MSASFDTIVVGLGAMGSATAYELARRGNRVLGLERFDIPNAVGSSHGHSRVTRLAYYEHPDYVPLLRRSFDLWPELQRELGQTIFHPTGCLSIGPPDGQVIAGITRSAAAHHIPHDRLPANELRHTYPQFVLPDDCVGVLDHAGGILLPERIVAGYAELALRHGADLHGHEPVLAWQADGAGVQVTTPKDTYRAAQLLFCGGAWTSKLIADLGVPLTVTRQALCWVWPKRPELFARGRLPVWIVDQPGGLNHYGFPMLPDNPGVKIATHARGAACDPDRLNRDPTVADEQTVRPFLRTHLPDADGPLLSCRICLYTNSPDGHFILDRHPRHPNVLLACGFSGHGFKFCNVIGQALADLALTGQTPLPVGFLALGRFGASTP